MVASFETYLSHSAALAHVASAAHRSSDAQRRSLSLAESLDAGRGPVPSGPPGRQAETRRPIRPTGIASDEYVKASAATFAADLPRRL
jgi:hypothetical protein